MFFTDKQTFQKETKTTESDTINKRVKTGGSPILTQTTKRYAGLLAYQTARLVSASIASGADARFFYFEINGAVNFVATRSALARWVEGRRLANDLYRGLGYIVRHDDKGGVSGVFAIPSALGTAEIHDTLLSHDFEVSAFAPVAANLIDFALARRGADTPEVAATNSCFLIAKAMPTSKRRHRASVYRRGAGRNLVDRIWLLSKNERKSNNEIAQILSDEDQRTAGSTAARITPQMVGYLLKWRRASISEDTGTQNKPQRRYRDALPVII